MKFLFYKGHFFKWSSFIYLRGLLSFWLLFHISTFIYFRGLIFHIATFIPQLFSFPSVMLKFSRLSYLRPKQRSTGCSVVGEGLAPLRAGLDPQTVQSSRVYPGVAQSPGEARPSPSSRGCKSFMRLQDDSMRYRFLKPMIWLFSPLYDFDSQYVLHYIY